MGYIVFANGHTGLLPATVMLCELRVECNNMLTKALNMSTSKILQAKHTASVLLNTERLAFALDIARGQFLATQEQYEELSKIVLKPGDLEKIVKVAFSQNENIDPTGNNRKSRVLDAIESAFHSSPGASLKGFAGTGLGLHEAFTYYFTHGTGGDTTKTVNRLNRLLFGNAKDVIAKADTAILALR